MFVSDNATYTHCTVIQERTTMVGHSFSQCIIFSCISIWYTI